MCYLLLIVILASLTAYAPTAIAGACTSATSNAICNITQLVLNASSFRTGDVNIKNTLDAMFEANQDYGTALPTESCVQYFADFYCSDFYPLCSNSSNQYNQIRACASACTDLISACSSYDSLFLGPLYIPANCTTYSTAKDCTFIENFANLLFYYGSPPSTTTYISATTDFRDGAILGAGLLLGLLLLIGGLSFIMYRQDLK